MIVKKNFKSVISFLLAFLMLVTSVLVFPENAEAASSTVNTVEELQNEVTKGEDSENKDQESEKQLINGDKTDSEEIDGIKYDANGDDFAILADKEEPSGWFEIKSTDATVAEPNTTLPGVEITIKDDKGDIVFDGKTGEDGIAKTEVLPKGSYKLKAISPFGYKLENTEMDIKIEKEGINEVNVKAEKNLAGAVLYKIDKDKEEQVGDRALSGAKFDIYSRHDYYGANGLVKTGDKVADGIVTNSGGMAWEFLPPGEYEYEEIEAPEGYKKIEGRQKFTVPLVAKNKEFINYWVRNEKIKNEEIKYEVSFDTDGGTTVASQMITPGDKAIKPTPEPTKDGFKFAGWYYINHREMKKYDFDTPVKADIKLYAKWTPIDEAEPYGWFKITMTKGTVAEPNIPLPGVKITIINDKDEEVFVGYTDKNGIMVKGLPVGSYKYTREAPFGYMSEEEGDEGKIRDFKIEKEDDAYSTSGSSGKNRAKLMLYKIDKDKEEDRALSGAVFNIYSKHKHYQGGLIQIGDKVADKIVTDSSGMVEVILSPGKYEYEEVTAPEGYKNIEGKVEFTVPLVEKDGDYVYEWVRNEKIKYTVSFDSDGGTTVADQEVGHGDKATVPTPEPTKDGFKLEGWYKDEAHTEKYDFATPVTEDIKLYAKWDPAYTVKFNSDGGTPVADQTVVHGETATVPAEPTKDGYTFIEWQLNGVAYDFATPVTENITLLATWKADTPQPGTKYTVTYYGNNNTGGTVPVDSKQYSSGDTVTVEGRNTLYRTNYTFKGWSTSKYATKAEYTAGETFTITKDTPLYAVWEKDSEDSGTGWTWSGGSSTTSKEKPKVEETLTHMSYLNGYPDNTIRPQGSITRAEVATIFARLKVGEANIPSAKANYSDVNASDWYAKYIAFVTDNEIMEGYEDGSFKPNGKITRAEFTAVVARYNSLADTTSTFEDVIGHWAAGYIGSVTNKGWINGYPDGTFKPEKDISREEVATMVNKMLDRKVDKDGLNNLSIKNFKDLDNSSWSYFDIVEASNSHKSVRRTLGDIMENWKELIK